MSSAVRRILCFTANRRRAAQMANNIHLPFSGNGFILGDPSGSSIAFQSGHPASADYSEIRRLTNRPQDIDDFLAEYPDLTPDLESNVNLDFYRGTGKMQPGNMAYEEFMSAFEKDYEELELNHGYIQWLFPIREKGLNYQSRPLQLHEIQMMSSDRAVLARLLRSYRMMLAFYGIDFNNGHLRLTVDHLERLFNLYHHPHNLLRITRILKCLSEFPLLKPHVPLLILFFTALHSEGYIDLSPAPHHNMHGQSLDNWWSNCIRDQDLRTRVRRIVTERGPCAGFRWGFEQFDDWYAGCQKGWTGALGGFLDDEGTTGS
ncbi:opioid growth factor receptor conserved region-domain-containing protein [Kockovaella imperatae]|uniref:Opioid growth factor receptor conserved region-domain-containing protein n=1 Tax=Kockovaella imperatae TaxID=4999 RepID=A0A1Y1U9I2_9TREE|nr:opioid growth factor receptor conserved region-domain-containing protein [Kockovaella imperatae]ORX34688.1 opioid growth factor receptor conserved region-domain-containing protein [Kockovaella imperatae]